MTRPAEKSADAIVKGRMHISATDDASVGTISVDTVYAGVVRYEIGFIAPGMDEPAGPAIFFLEPDKDNGFRLVRTELDVTREPAIADARADFSAVTAALDVFRKAKGKEWNPAQQPAVEAAHMIFETVPMIGAPASEIRRALGEPDEITASGWRYVRHNGESGAIFVLRIANDRVRAIEIHRTQ